MTVFVTGASGYLGSRLIKTLENKHKVRTLSGNLNNPNAWESDLRESDCVIHLAAITHGTQDQYEEVNVIGTNNLITIAKKEKIKRIIYVSTRAVGNICGAYGKSKESAEHIIIESGIPFVIARPAEVYSSNLAGREGLGKLANIIKKFPIVPYIRDSRARVAPIHIDDVIASLDILVNNPNLTGMYTLAGPETLSFRETIIRMCHYFGVKRILLPMPLFLWKLIYRVSGTRDQLQRLLCHKDGLGKNVYEDLGIIPRKFLQ